MNGHIVIVGAGHAAAQVVDSLRREGFTGALTLVGDEPHLPYQRPPLSKKYLAGDLEHDRLLLRSRMHYDEHRIALRLDQRVEGGVRFAMPGDVLGQNRGGPDRAGDHALRDAHRR